jgi:hypothetical protein
VATLTARKAFYQVYCLQRERKPNPAAGCLEADSRIAELTVAPDRAGM